MKRIAAVLMAVCVMGLMAPAVPAGAGELVKGRFEQVFRQRGMPHQVYFWISTPVDVEYCQVTLRRKTTTVPMDVDSNESGIEGIYYHHVRFAKRAVRQGRNTMPDVTRRIKCLPES